MESDGGACDVGDTDLTERKEKTRVTDEKGLMCTGGQARSQPGDPEEPRPRGKDRPGLPRCVQRPVSVPP